MADVWVSEETIMDGAIELGEVLRRIHWLREVVPEREF